MADDEPPLRVEVASGLISLQNVFHGPHPIHGGTVQRVLVGGIDKLGKPGMQRDGILRIRTGRSAHGALLGKPSDRQTRKSRSDTCQKLAVDSNSASAPPSVRHEGLEACESFGLGRPVLRAFISNSLSSPSPSSPVCRSCLVVSCGSPATRRGGQTTAVRPGCTLEKHRPAQFLGTKGPTNLVASQRQPLGSTPAALSLVTAGTRLSRSPLQDEVETKQLLTQAKVEDTAYVQWGRIGHRFFRYN